MNATPAPSTYRRPEAKPYEPLTPHELLSIAQRTKGNDGKRLQAFSYHMMDDTRKIRQLTEGLRVTLDALEHCARLPVVEQAEAKARELLEKYRGSK